MAGHSCATVFVSTTGWSSAASYMRSGYVCKTKSVPSYDQSAAGRTCSGKRSIKVGTQATRCGWWATVTVGRGETWIFYQRMVTKEGGDGAG